MDAETTAGWNRWADQRIAAATSRLAKDMTDAIMEHLQERFTRSRQLTNERVQGVEDRLTRSESATVELIVALEREVKELRERVVLKPVKPKLVGGSGDGPA